MSDAPSERPKMERSMLSPAEVADRWGLNVKTVYAAIKAKQLASVRIGRRVLIPRAVVASIEQARVGTPGE